ncbi:MAG: dihydrodipicolinate synthase family protein [Pseudomonadota bacterium]
MSPSLKGVIAAVITPIDHNFEPDTGRLIARMAHLLTHGCDGINLLGTTGEATSFSRQQRLALMQAVATGGLPMHRIMVGTGAANLQDTIALSCSAADFGFAGALLLPPFYYKPITPEGLTRYVGAVVRATEKRELPIYLYNFPALSGIAYSPEIVEALTGSYGNRIAGLKDSSGDLDYARTITDVSPDLKVFPSNEATLLHARSGAFAGCISATANLNFEDCARAFHDGDEDALSRAVSVREAFAGIPLVPAIKAEVARRLGDPVFANLVPPLDQLSKAQREALQARITALD